MAVALLTPTVGGAAEPPARLFVLDSRAPALHVVDATTGQIQQTAALSGQPVLLTATPDGSRLLVLDRGPGKDEGERGWAATGRSSVTLVDTGQMRVLGRVELGWGLSLQPGAVLSPDGQRAALVCPGYQAKKPEQRLAAELVVVDIGAVKVAGRITLDRPPRTWVAGMNGRRAYVLLPRANPKVGGSSASVIAIDLDTAATAGTLPFDGDVTELLPSPAGRLLYVLDRGKPSGNAEKNVNGRLHVVSVEPFSPLGVLDVGSGPRGVFFEESSQALLAMALATPVKGVDQKGELRVVRGDKVEETIPIGSGPLFLRRSPDGRQLFAVGEKGIKMLSLPALTSIRDVPIEGAGMNWMSDTQPGHPNDLAVTPDGGRGLVTYENSSKLLVLDLATGTKVASVTTGRKGAKLAKMAAATALNAASYYSERENAIRSGQTTFSYDVYGIRGASTAMALRADGRFAYVLNSQTNDVTVVDTANATALDKLAAGGHELLSLPTGRLVAVVSGNALSVLDTTSNSLTGKWELPGLLGLAVAPDRPAVVAVAEKSLLFLDPTSGKVNARVDSFMGNTDWLFVGRRLPPKAKSPAPPEKVKPN